MSEMNEKQLIEKHTELHDYFRDQMTSGKFIVNKRQEHTYQIEINNFSFIIWIANGASSIQTTERYDTSNTMKIEFRGSDKNKFWAHLEKDMNETIIKEKEEKEKAEFERLKEKYN